MRAMKEEIKITKFQAIIILTVLSNAIEFASKEDKNAPYSCYYEAVEIKKYLDNQIDLLNGKVKEIR